MKIAISGATGLIGKKLRQHLLQQGHEVAEITRHKHWMKKSSTIYWNTKAQYIDPKELEGYEVIIHLAGANISSQSWSESYKQEIIKTRVESTRALVGAIHGMNKRPKLFLCASAIGYYGNHDELKVINERSTAGKGFLSQVCQEWENASSDLILFGVRVVYMRFGVVLSNKGGALSKMLPVFYFGLGGRLGHGRQKMSWISIEEIPLIVDFIMSNPQVSGPVNVVSPIPVTNREFTKALGKVIGRPTILPVPGFMIRMLFGEMGQTLLLEGAHVLPQVLMDKGYQFKYPQIEPALKQILCPT